MKRLLACITLVVLLITALPVTGFANGYTYTKDDIMSAVNGMGRMPSTYYNLAGIALEMMPGFTTSQAENFSKKLYSMWAFLEKHAYVYYGNAAIKDTMTYAQWTAVTSYISDLAYNYGSGTIVQLLLNFMNSSKAMVLVKTAVPRSLFGIQFDDATLGQPATVKVYTTTDVPSGAVLIKDSNGNIISTNAGFSQYMGTLATYNEHILTVNYPYAGKNAVRIYGVDSKFADNYLSTSAYVAKAPVSETTGTNNSATVLKLSSNKATLGTPSAITVTASGTTTYVKITDNNGTILTISDDPVTSGTSKVFTINYCFPSTSQYIRAYAGTMSDSNILWNKNYKTTRVTVNPAASEATMSRAIATTQFRGQEATVTITASSKVTRVRLFDADGDIVDFTRVYNISGRNRVFSLEYTETKAGNFKVYAQAGNDLDWNTARRNVTVKFNAPVVTAVSSTSALRGTDATITATASAVAQTARLLDAAQHEIAVVSKGGDGKFTFTWGQDSAGRKVIYVQVDDGHGWSAMKSATVTFTAPAITKITATRVPHGTASTITVRASATADEIELYDSRKVKLVPESIVDDGNGNFVIMWSQPTRGTKTVYLRINDGLGWSGYYKSSVTFT